jgi:hypothetical protein
MDESSFLTSQTWTLLIFRDHSLSQTKVAILKTSHGHVDAGDTVILQHLEVLHTSLYQGPQAGYLSTSPYHDLAELFC